MIKIFNTVVLTAFFIWAVSGVFTRTVEIDTVTVFQSAGAFIAAETEDLPGIKPEGFLSELEMNIYLAKLDNYVLEYQEVPYGEEDHFRMRVRNLKYL